MLWSPCITFISFFVVPSSVRSLCRHWSDCEQGMVNINWRVIFSYLVICFAPIEDAFWWVLMCGIKVFSITYLPAQSHILIHMPPSHVILTLYLPILFLPDLPDRLLFNCHEINVYLTLDFFSFYTKWLTRYTAWNSVHWNFLFPCYCLSSLPMNETEINFPSIFYRLHHLPNQLIHVVRMGLPLLLQLVIRDILYHPRCELKTRF